MKKCILFIMVSILILSSFATLTYAADKDETAEELNELKTGDGLDEMEDLNDIQKSVKDAGYSVSKLIQTVGNVIGFLVFLMFGIQYMTANNKKKAELKEQGMSMVVGAILFFGGWNVFFLVYKLAKSLTGSITG